MPDDLPPAADLFGREVVNSGGAQLGRIEIVVRLPDGEGQADGWPSGRQGHPRSSFADAIENSRPGGIPAPCRLT